MTDIIFGTGGWRAEIGDEFIRANIEKVGQALADMINADHKADKPVVIGYDRRFLSDRATVWLSQVLAANGIKTLIMKRSAPTPLVMHTVKKMGLHYGLECTASHNPPSYNGIKLVVEEGRDAPLEVTRRLEGIIRETTLAKSIPLAEGIASGLIEYIKSPFNAFIDDIISQLDMAAIRERGLRILFNPMHGSGTYPLEVILNTARCTVDLYDANKDPYFGGGYPAPSEETLKTFILEVKHGGYDLGIAFDGDGDRLGIIGSDGSYVSSNDILLMLYWYLHEKKGWKGGVVRNVSTTHLLDKMAADFGEICYEVPVGFKWVSKAIDEHDCILGGESSGGLTVRGHIFGKDSVYAASLFVEMVSKTNMTPSEILSEIHGRYGTTVFMEKAIHFDSERKAYVNSKILGEKLLPELQGEIEKVDYMDGAKVYFKDGSFVSCRFSGTEPLLRIMAEAYSEDAADASIKAFASFVEAL